jgi:hypothetical protein
MRYRTLVAATVMALGLAVAARAAFIDRLAAVVSGQIITLSDVNAARLLALVPAPAAGTDPVAGFIDRLIERDLMLAEVNRYEPPEPAAEEIDRRVAEITQRAGGHEALERTLAVTGMTDEQLRRWMRDDLRIQTYLNQRFGTRDPAARAQLITDWLTGLRRRADVRMLYVARSS